MRANPASRVETTIGAELPQKTGGFGAKDAKRGYQTPKLTPLGQLGELTQSGSSQARENKPHPGPDRRA